MNPFLLWDSASRSVLFCAVMKKGSIIINRTFPRKALSSAMPGSFHHIIRALPDIPGNTEVYVGTGPGSFTGVKTGNAFFLSWLYARGIHTVRTFSSHQTALLTPATQKDGFYIVITPFNRHRYFISTFKITGGTVLTHRHNDYLTYHEFKTLAIRINASEITLIASGETFPEITELLKRLTDKLHVVDRIATILPNRIHRLDTTTVDIRTEPLMLDYVLQPAGLSSARDTSFYTPFIPRRETPQ